MRNTDKQCNGFSEDSVVSMTNPEASLNSAGGKKEAREAHDLSYSTHLESVFKAMFITVLLPHTAVGTFPWLGGSLGSKSFQGNRSLPP